MLRDIYLRPKRNLDVTLHTVRAFFFGGGGEKNFVKLNQSTCFKCCFCLFKFGLFFQS